MLFSVFDKKQRLKAATTTLQHLITFWYNSRLNSGKFTSNLSMCWTFCFSLGGQHGLHRFYSPFPGGNGSWAQFRAQMAAGGTARPGGQQVLPSPPESSCGDKPSESWGKNRSLFREAKPTGTLSVFNIIHRKAFKNSFEFTAVAV